MKLCVRLVHPGQEAQDDIAVANDLDQRIGLRLPEDKVQLTHGSQAAGHGGDGIVIGIDAEFEFEAAFRVAGIVEDDGLEDGRVGDAQMIAVERHQDCGARSQPDDLSLMLIDEDMVVGAKGLA